MQYATNMGGAGGVGLALFGATAVAWFAYFRAKNEWRTGPAWLGVLAAVGGFLAIFPALAAYSVLETVGLSVSWELITEARPGMALSRSMLIGVVEEGAKMMPVLLVAFGLRKLERPCDGLLVAACAGVGFATAESTSLMLFGELSLMHGLARAAAAPVTHALFSAPFGLGIAHLATQRRWAPLLAGAAISVTSHALYDFLLARPGVPKFVAASVVLALWLWVLGRTAPLELKLRRSIVAAPRNVGAARMIADA